MTVETQSAHPDEATAQDIGQRRYPVGVTLNSVNAPVKAVVTVPGSKSITNRALLVAALAEGETVLRAPLFSDDTLHMIAALRALGVLIGEQSGGDLIVGGVGGRFRQPQDTLFIGNSGTSVRFLAAACVHLPEGESCALDGAKPTVTEN